MSEPLIVQCPTCSAPVEWSAESRFRPFCSQRCRLIDLGAWASEQHVIAGEQLNPEDVPFSDELAGHTQPRH